ncbi:MAG TPA: hypothetical protein VD997_11055 [Phycisphaerales bacterium]|nr:hypothetical protein [Phycisphaerales bacterium]
MNAIRTAPVLAAALGLAAIAFDARAQATIDPAHTFCWGENAGWINWGSSSSASVTIAPSYLAGHLWAENLGWITLGDGPGSAGQYANTSGLDHGVNVDNATGHLSGFAWSENAGWINFGGGALADPPQPARIDFFDRRLRGYAWGENIGWINLDDASVYVGTVPGCGSQDFNGDGDSGTDADIEAFFACLAGNCCSTCGSSDFNADGDYGTDADIESFFRVLGGSAC